MTPNDELLERLGTTWDSGDAAAWAANFEDDVDFVDVLGRRQKGRAVVAREHQHLFDTIYAGSTCAFRELDCRLLAGDLRLVHTATRLSVPSGPRRGQKCATQTMLVRGDLVVAFHNRVQAELAGFTGQEDGFAAPAASPADAPPPDPTRRR